MTAFADFIPGFVEFLGFFFFLHWTRSFSFVLSQCRVLEELIAFINKIYPSAAEREL